MSASYATIAASSGASSARSLTRLWSRRCATSSRNSPNACARRRRPALRLTLAALALCATVSACDTFEYDGFLNKPIPIQLHEDVPIIPVMRGTAGPFDAVVDTGSPLNVIDTDGNGNGKSTRGELRLQHGLEPDISRFIFYDVETFDLPLKPIGLNSQQTIEAVVGSTLLSHFSVRFTYGPRPELTLSNEVPDSKSDLARECDPTAIANGREDPLCQAAFSSARTGGGLVLMDDPDDKDGPHKVTLPASRLPLLLCLQPAIFSPTETPHGAETTTGVPVQAIVATGLGTSVLTRSALQRLQAADPSLTVQATATLHLASGEQAVELVQLDRVAVVSDETDHLNPCGELALRRRLLLGFDAPLTDADRALIDDKGMNGANAALALGGVSFAVVPDEAPLIQGLRKELGAKTADVDVVLGGSLLRAFDLVVDYPSKRIMLRCRQGSPEGSCRVLPWCGNDADERPRCPGLGS